MRLVFKCTRISYKIIMIELQKCLTTIFQGSVNKYKSFFKLYLLSLFLLINPLQEFVLTLINSNIEELIMKLVTPVIFLILISPKSAVLKLRVFVITLLYFSVLILLMAANLSLTSITSFTIDSMIILFKICTISFIYLALCSLILYIFSANYFIEMGMEDLLLENKIKHIITKIRMFIETKKNIKK